MLPRRQGRALLRAMRSGPRALTLGVIGTLIIGLTLAQPAGAADGLVEAVAARRQDRRAGLVEDLPLHRQALDLRIGGGKEADAAGFRRGDIVRTEVQETTLKQSKGRRGANRPGAASGICPLLDTDPFLAILSR